MNKHFEAFTLIELLIAMVLSSFIMMGMMQGQRNVMRFLNNSRKLMTINRKVCLLFNQMERDFTSAFIPEPSKPSELDDVNKIPEKKESDHNYFFSTVQEGLESRIQGKKYQLLDKVTFITSHPLQLFGERRVRLVRVMYQLQIDRERKKGDRLVYSLVRKETTNLENSNFKEKESEEGKDVHSIRTHVVADNLRDVYIECLMPKPKKSEIKEQEGGEDEMVASFIWGGNKETKDVVPQYIRLYVRFWNEELTSDYPFECVIPIFVFSKKVKEEDKKKTDLIKGSVELGESKIDMQSRLTAKIVKVDKKG